MKRICTLFLISLLLVGVMPAFGQVAYDQTKSVTRNQVDALITIANTRAGTLTGDLTFESGDAITNEAAGTLILPASNLTLTLGDATLTDGDVTLTSGNLALTLGDATLTDGDVTLTSGNLALTLGDATLTDGDVTLTSGDLTLTDGDVALYGDAMFSGGTTGGLKLITIEATATLTGASTDILINIPSGVMLLGTQVRVDTLITSGDGATSWGAAYKTGATATITTGQAFTKNTKASAFFDANAATNITSNVTVITISPNANTFSAGVVRAISYYYVFEAMADAS